MNKFYPKRLFAFIVMLNCLQIFFTSSVFHVESTYYQNAGSKVGGAITGQPFAIGNGGSKFFRIPAIITL